MKRARLILAAAILAMAAAGCAQSRGYDPCARADFEASVVRIRYPLGSCCHP